MLLPDCISAPKSKALLVIFDSLYVVLFGCILFCDFLRGEFRGARWLNFLPSLRRKTGRFSIGSVLSRNINYFCIPHTGQKLWKYNSIVSSLRTASACQNYENPTKVTRPISKTTLVLLFITFLALSQNDTMKSILPTTPTSVGEYWSHSDSDFSVQQSVFFWNNPTFSLNQLCLGMTSYMLSPQSPWRFLEHIPSCKGPYSVYTIFFLRLWYERRGKLKG